MSLPFSCPACGVSHLVSLQAQGKRVRCPHCDQIVEVPPAGSTAAPITSQPAVAEAEEAVPPPILTAEPVETHSLPPLILADPADPVQPFSLHRTPTPPILTEAASKTELAEAAPPAKAFSMGKKREPIQAEMDMTPMVDVTFLLLIFFMVTASFTMQKSQQIPKPQQSDGSAQVKSLEDIRDNPDYVTVRIDSQNTFHVSAPSMEDEQEAPSRNELVIKVKQARQPDKQGKVPNKLLILAHGDALHARVVAAIDVGTDVGMEEVQLLKVEEDP